MPDSATLKKVKYVSQRCEHRTFFCLVLGFIYFFVGPQVYKYDCTQKHVVGVEKANSWLGCLNAA